MKTSLTIGWLFLFTVIAVPAWAEDYVVGRQSIDTRISALEFDPDTGLLLGVSEGEDAQLMSIDPATGAAHVIGPIGHDWVKGLALDPDAGILYATDAVNFLVVDPQTGAGLNLGSMGVSPQDYVWGLAYDRMTGTLYGLGRPGIFTTVYRIDVLSGLAMPLGSVYLAHLGCLYFGAGPAILALTFDENTGVLYAMMDATPSYNVWSNRVLVRIDPIQLSGGTLTGANHCGEYNYLLSGLAFDPAHGTLYGTTNPGIEDSSFLLDIDPATGFGGLAASPAPDADFADIQSAIDGARAGDTLRVMPGSYEPFDLYKGLRILGDPGGCVDVRLPYTGTNMGSSSVTGIAAGETALVSNLSFGARLGIAGCEGLVLIRDIDCEGATIQDAADVRVHRSSIADPVADPFAWPGGDTASLVVRDSRVELVGSLVEGAPGWCEEPFDPCQGVDCGGGDGLGDVGLPPFCIPGGAGLEVESGFLHITLSDVLGGEDPGGGPRRLAMSVLPGSEVSIAGTDHDLIEGHAFGVFAGPEGIAVSVSEGASLRASGITILGDLGGGGRIVMPRDPDPTLRVLEPFSPGSPLSYLVHGTPGASVTLLLSWLPAQSAAPTSVIEQLLRPVRALDIGTIGRDGTSRFSFVVPLDWPDAALLVAQAEVTSPEGWIRRTNTSMPSP